MWRSDMPYKGKVPAFLVGLAALVISLVGCSTNGDNTVVDPGTSAARFMFVQASPDAPPVDLYVDSVRVDSNVVYRDSTGYIDFAAGTRELRIVRPGTLQTLYLALVPVVSGMSYTIFGIDSVARYKSMLLVDNLTPPASGKSSVRFVHVSPNAPAVDVAIQGGIALFTNEPFKGKTDFVPLDAGTYSFDIKIAGTPTVLTTVQNDSLLAGKIYTIYLRGFAGGAGTTAIDAGILTHN